MKSVSSLWIGQSLSPYEAISLQSFAREGFNVYLYTYEPSLETPDGVTPMDANKIINFDRVFENPSHKGTFAGFSNVFRYELLRSVDTMWIDSDVVALSNEIRSTRGYVFGWESPVYVNGAILGAPGESDFVKKLNDEAARVNPNSFQWGDLGPKLITRIVRELGLEDLVQAPKTFYPVEFRDAWKFFDPSSTAELERSMEGSQVFHWWNEALRRLPFNIKGYLPPEGSYFGNLFEGHVFDSHDMKRLNSSWARRVWKSSIERPILGRGWNLLARHF